MKIVRTIKKIIKNLISPSQRELLRCWYKELNRNGLKYAIRITFIKAKTPGSIESVDNICRVIRKSKPREMNGFFYTYNPKLKRVLSNKFGIVASLTLDYDIVLKSDINKIEEKLSLNFIGNNVGLKKILDSIKDKAHKIACKYSMNKNAVSLFENLQGRPKTLEEALQKILFYNGFLWQLGHLHNGLGRLDMVLYPYYIDDISKGILDRETAKGLILKFVKVIGHDTISKSPWLIGDTGQYILLGGLDQNGETVNNELTQIFLEIFTENSMSDPKLILRVNSQTPHETYLSAIECLATGCGSPLIMNESVIIPNMERFGYEKNDVWNIGTSACWEPLIIGKSACQNNPFRSIIATDAIERVLMNGEYNDFESFLQKVIEHLSLLSIEVVKDLNTDSAPIFSLFSDESIERGKDFMHGGAKYMFNGAQLLALPNLVNSLLNIKKYVFQDHLITLRDCKDAIQQNFDGHEDLEILFKQSSELKFGNPIAEVIELTNRLIASVSIALSDVTSNGSRIKFGLSSPAYVDLGLTSNATLDGRRKGQPFAVHISPVSSEIDIIKILRFASEISYPVNCLNGNVVDFIVPSAYRAQPEKLASIIEQGFNEGTFEMQLNVLDKSILIDAKQHPEKYPQLIVRVWGFSAYFNDLPESYKDNLIARAQTYGAA